MKSEIGNLHGAIPFCHLIEHYLACHELLCCTSVACGDRVAIKSTSAQLDGHCEVVNFSYPIAITTASSPLPSLPSCRCARSWCPAVGRSIDH